MTDKELGITVTADIDDAIDNLKDLIDTISNIPDDTKVNVDTSNLDDVDAKLKDVEQDIQDVSSETVEVDTTDSVSAMDALNTSTDDTSSSLDGASDSASGADSSLDKLDNTTQNTSSSMSDLTGAMGGVESLMRVLVGIGIGAFFTDAINSAGAFEQQWSQIGLVMGDFSTDTSQIEGDWSSAMSQMQSDTGRTGSVIRSTMIDLGVAGITAQSDVVSAFDAIAGDAYATGNSIDAVTSAFTRVVETGSFSTRTLVALGLTTQDVYKATGKSMDELSTDFKNMTSDQRAAMLEQIMDAKYGQQANDAYKDSWQHLTDSMQAAWGYIVRIFGEMLLPIAIPVVESLTSLLNNLANGINSLSAPMKDILGATIFLVGGLTTLFLIVGPTISLFEKLAGSIAGNLTKFAGLEEGATLVEGALGSLGKVGILSMEEVVVGVDEAGVAMMGLDVAIGPVGWALLALTAIVAAGIYIWANWHDQVMQLWGDLTGGDWGGAAAMIGNAFNYAGQQIWNFLANLPMMLAGAIGNFAAWGAKAAETLLQSLVNGLYSLATGLANILGEMLEPAGNAGSEAGSDMGSKLITGLSDWIRDNGPTVVYDLEVLFGKVLPLVAEVIGELELIVLLKIAQLLEQLDSWIISSITGILEWILVSIASWVGSLVAEGVKAGEGFINGILTWLNNGINSFGQWATSMIQQGIKAGQGFVNGVVNFIKNLPNMVWTNLIQTLDRIAYFAGLMLRYAIQGGQNFVNGIINYIRNLPTNLWNVLTQTITRATQFAQQLYTHAVQAGQNFLNGVINFVRNLPGQLWALLLQAINNVVSFAQQAYTNAVTAGQNILNGIITFVTNLPGQLWDLLVQAINHVLDFGNQAGSDANSAGQSILTNLINAITGLPDAVWNEFMQIKQKIEDAISSLGQAAWNAGAGIVQSFLSGLGIASPGHMFKALVGELGIMDDALGTTTLGSTAGGLGSSIASGFTKNISALGNLASKTGLKSSANAGNVISILFEGVENMVKINNPSSNVDVKNAGSNFADGFLTKLKREMGARGQPF